MTDAKLTRELFLVLMERIAANNGDLDTDIRTANAHDAAQRERIEALEKDKERYRLDAEKHYRAATECEQQLTAMEKERDLLKAQCEAQRIDKAIHWTCDHDHQQQLIQDQQTALTACRGKVTVLVKELEGALQVLSAMVFVCRKGAVPLETLTDAEDVLKQHALAQGNVRP